MKFLRETVVRGKTEWRIIGHLHSPITEVVSKDSVRQFHSPKEAYAYVIRQVRRYADNLSQLQPGARVQLPMQTGSPRVMNVMTNGPDGVTLNDPATGQQMMIPHLNGQPQPLSPNSDGTSGTKLLSPGTGTVQARRKVAFPPPPGPPNPQQPGPGPQGPGPQGPPGAGPPGSSPNAGPPERPDLPNQNPKLTSGQGRMLTRHEIIQESETLIRNALWRGVRIGVQDLVEYLTQQYSNRPEELREGAKQAWENVRFEDEDLFNQATGPGPDQESPAGPSGRPGAPPRSEPAEWGLDDEEGPPEAFIE